jgi:hypothetical protein
MTHSFGRAKMRALVSLAAAAVVTVLWGCNQATINTPTRVFDRPSDVALACRQLTTDPAHPPAFIYDPHPISDCTPESISQLTPKDSTGNPLFTDTGFFEGPVLAALVAQSARGELALVDVSQEHIVDLQAPVPGYGFIPVGKLPEHVRVSDDGCRAVTANVASCDVTIIDLPTLYNMPFLPYRSPPPSPGFADQVVRRLTPTVGGKPLGARPTWVEMAPYTAPAARSWEKGPDGSPLPEAVPGQCRPRAGTTRTEYRAWAALPGCALVVELDVSATEANPSGMTPAEVTRALRFTSTGVELVSDPSMLATLSCPQECEGEPVLMSDADGGVDADAGTDGGSRLPTTQAQPSTLAMDNENGLARLIIGDRTGERITFLSFDATSGTLGAPRQLTLDAGALGVLVLRVSPRSEAGKFLYAVARDASVRVIDLDREAECETNPDPRVLQGIPDNDPRDRARFFGCFPLGDPSTPRRAPLFTSPGITLPGLALPKDVAFVHVNAPPPVATNIAPPAAGPSTLVGDFAWLVSSDGRATVINIFDACPAPNQPQLKNGAFTPACSLDAVDDSRASAFANNFGHPLPMDLDRVAHRLRGGSSRFFQPANPSDNVGQTRIADETNPFQLSVAGVPKASNSKDLSDLPALVSEPYPPLPSPFPELPAAIDKRYLSFFDPDKVRSETWVAAWEGEVPGTHRTLASVSFLDEQGQALAHPKLRDNGAAYCARGVLTGDKLLFPGCDTDNDCPFLDTCVRDPPAPSDVNLGMCLRRQDLAQLQDTCKELLRAVRRYRILSAKQGVKVDAQVDNSGITDELELGEIYQPEHPVETRTCTQGADDCHDVTVLNADGTVALPTTCLADADGVFRCLRACHSNGSDREQACGPDFQCLRSRFGNDRCMRAQLDPAKFEACMPELQTYEIHAGEAFLIEGSATGVFSDLQANPQTRECEIPPQSSEYVRLHQARIPIEPPAQCPASLITGDRLGPLPPDFLDPVSGVATNVCQIEPDLTPRPGHAVARVIHFENPMFSFLLSVKAGPAASPAPTASPAPSVDKTVPPDQLTLSFTLVGSGFPLGLALAIDVQAQQPRYAVTAPDRQTVFVVDEGKQSVGVGLRGQLLKLSSEAVAIDRSFQVR